MSAAFAVRPRTLGLGAASLVALALAVRPWLPEPLPPDHASAAHVPDDMPRLAPLPPFATFGATLERPLFTPSRRPPAGVAASDFTTGIAERYRLQGLIIAGTARHALLAPTAGGPTLELAEGQTVEGWTIRQIEQDRVTLSSVTGETTLVLQRQPSSSKAAR